MLAYRHQDKHYLLPVTARSSLFDQIAMNTQENLPFFKGGPRIRTRSYFHFLPQRSTEIEGKKGRTTQKEKEKQQHPTEERSGSSTTRKDPFPTARPPLGRNTQKNTSRKQGEKAKLDPCSMIPLFERQRHMQVAMLGLLGELSVNCST